MAPEHSLALRQAMRRQGLDPDAHQALRYISDHLKCASEKLGRGVATITLGLFKKAGMIATPEAALTYQIAFGDSWSPAHSDLTDGMARALYRSSGHEKLAQEGVLSSMAGTIAKMTPEIWHNLLMTGALLGSTTGAMAWHYGRNVNQDDIDNAQMSAEAQQYRNLADEVKREISLNRARLGFAQKPQPLSRAA